jgi:hypothetical protein
VILQRLLIAIGAAAAIAAAAAVSVVALAFAVFALARAYVGPAGASAIVAAAFAITVGLVGVIAANAAAKGRKRMERELQGETMGMIAQIIGLGRDKPLLLAGVALLLGVILMRSPRSVAAIVRAFFESMIRPRSQTE